MRVCGIWSTTHCLPLHKNLILQGSLFLYITERWPVYCFFSFSPTLHCSFWGDTPLPRAKEKPQQDGRRGKIMFRIKPHTCQRHSEVSNIPCMPQDPESPPGSFAHGILPTSCQSSWKACQKVGPSSGGGGGNPGPCCHAQGQVAGKRATSVSSPAPSAPEVPSPPPRSPRPGLAPGSVFLSRVSVRIAKLRRHSKWHTECGWQPRFFLFNLFN